MWPSHPSKRIAAWPLFAFFTANKEPLPPISSSITSCAITSKENLILNGLYDKKIRFLKKDIFEIEKLNKNVDYIISNPPYVGLLEYNLLEPEIRNNEPDIAVTDFGNGLKYYERIFSIAAGENFNGKVFCEMGFGQKEKIESLLREKGFKNYSFYNDYNNIPRIVKAEK